MKNVACIKGDANMEEVEKDPKRKLRLILQSLKIKFWMFSLKIDVIQSTIASSCLDLQRKNFAITYLGYLILITGRERTQYFTSIATKILQIKELAFGILISYLLGGR
ncbi:hypothetical protein HAX54_003596 [Datura stramonium]|uniref:Uncharacterized protein n=1 Tax=Datura stramonium TaxID=4076 RepID=A0ABS8T5K1_DATST|nr:hypothetical protein [Datura stramonium]